MDKQHDHIESKQNVKRPRWLTLCMMATAASVIVLAGCGDDEETAPPAEETAPLEQDNSSGQESSLEQDSEMEQDPGLNEDPGSEGSMTQSTGAESEEPMSEGDMSESDTAGDSMPEDTMDEPAGSTVNPDEDEAGFGEGTDPMPGDDDASGDSENED
ncbi:MAG TPA: hypothetical protein VLO13_03840, partial [Halomonas sp.]|nr:hypothetical protein [Halomonas sp.]